MRRQNGKCWLCDKPLRKREATFDHLVPKSMGGLNSLANLRLAHRECNASRDSNMHPVFALGLTDTLLGQAKPGRGFWERLTPKQRAAFLAVDDDTLGG